MKGPLRWLVSAVPIVLSGLLCGFRISPATTMATPIIATAAPAYDELAAMAGGERFPLGAHLLRIEGGVAEPLVNGFYATADADVSFDASHVLFAGKQTAVSPWQIWELTLANHSVRQVLTSVTDSVRPLYLPGDHFVFAQRESNGFRMQTAKLDGSSVLPLTYISASAMPSAVLKDGRILFQSTYPLNTGKIPEIYLVYSDGSGLESYRCDHGTSRWGGMQLTSGDIVFTHGPTIARFTSPMAVEKQISLPSASYAGKMAETTAGEWLISVKSTGMQHFDLRLWMPGASTFQAVYQAEAEDIVDPILLIARLEPNRHPSALHNWKTANLLALDSRESRTEPLAETPSYVQVKTLDDAGHTILLGRAPVAKDGSFFITVPGDQPLRLALLNSDGAVLREEQGWFWSRAGEQRICVGCHTGPERAPQNRIPAVLQRTTTPVDLSVPPPLFAKGGN